MHSRRRSSGGSLVGIEVSTGGDSEKPTGMAIRYEDASA
jgi:hypothetical protein